MKLLLLEWWQGGQLTVTEGGWILAIGHQRKGEPAQFTIERAARDIAYLRATRKARYVT